METEGILLSVVEDVIQQQGKRLSDIDMRSRRAEEAALRRYEAAGWLRRMVGVVGGKDLPAQPSEDEFRLGLRSGLIFCNVLNKVQPGAVPKVVEAPSVSASVPDGAALSAYQYFENVRNFLVAMEEMGLPTFEASDLEQGGKSSRIVNCVLALKSYNDWKQGGGIGFWKFGGNMKSTTSGKHFVLRNSEPFMNSLRNLSREKSTDSLSSEPSSCTDLANEFNETGSSCSLHTLVRELLLDKKLEEIPTIVETMIGKLMEEFEHHLTSQNEQTKMTTEDVSVCGPDKSSNGEIEKETTPGDVDVSASNKSIPESSSGEIKMEGSVTTKNAEENCSNKEDTQVEHQHKEIKEFCNSNSHIIQELKHAMHITKTDLQVLQMKYQEEVSNLGIRLQSLAHAASGYQKVLEENRKLYNQLQDLKGSIRVYCRVRPFFPGQPNRANSVKHIDEASITITTPSKYGKDGRKSFTFNKVFGPSATQGEVFSDMQPLIRSILDGYNVCIFAYGQTGSGKTYTMIGPKELTPETLGVNYRALSDLFIMAEQRKNIISYEVFVQMIEIYNEQVRDLLATDGVNKRLEIRNNSPRGINVPDASLLPVSSTADVINLMKLGLKNRAVGATAMNDRSSRSHSCLMVHVQGRELASGNVIRGCMHLVDLAGSERVDKSEVLGDRLKEATHINKSLSALGDVIASLAQKNSHVPYRNSKLTQLLQDSLGGQAKTLMFVHISPELDVVGETISTLKFAERVSTVELGTARVNNDCTEVKELKEQIASLKAALARKDGEPGHFQHFTMGSPERQRFKSAGSSPSHPGSSPSQLRSHSSGDLLAINLEGDWIDNMKQVGVDSEENLSGHWEERFDDLDSVTSDYSEADSLWLFNPPKVASNIPNGLVSSKLKKPSPKQAKTSEIRSLIPAPPTRRLSTGNISPLQKAARHPVPALDGKKRIGGGK